VQNLYDIIYKLSQNCNTNEKLEKVFIKVFDEKDKVKLFRYRALTIEQLDELVESLQRRGIDIDNLQKSTIKQMMISLSHGCTTQEARTIASGMTPAHVATLKGLVQLYGKQRDYSDEVDSIYTFKQELHKLIGLDKTLSDEQKEVLEEICSEVDALKFESKLSQSFALRKFLKSMYLKALLNKDELLNLQSKAIREKLVQIYKKVELLDSVVDVGMGLFDKVTFLGDFIIKVGYSWILTP